MKEKTLATSPLGQQHSTHKTCWECPLPRRGWFLGISVKRLQRFICGKHDSTVLSKITFETSSQRVEDMAHLGGLMSATVSGGEAEPNFPDFDRVMLVTGQVVTPRRVLPVVGFHGQELWPSDVGMRVGAGGQNTLADKGLHEGAPVSAKFNHMDTTRQHVEGGRHVLVKSKDKRRMIGSPLKARKRIKQNISLSSSEEEDDEDFTPAGTKLKYNILQLIFISLGTVVVTASDRVSRRV